MVENHQKCQNFSLWIDFFTESVDQYLLHIIFFEISSLHKFILRTDTTFAVKNTAFIFETVSEKTPDSCLNTRRKILSLP